MRGFLHASGYQGRKFLKYGENAFVRGLVNQLQAYDQNRQNLRGLTSPQHYTVLARQMRDAVRRIDFIKVIGNRYISPMRADPRSDLFDPIRASILHRKRGNFDEACWLAFLATHFGKNLETGWLLARQVYGALGVAGHWTWERVNDPNYDFKRWSVENEPFFTADVGRGGFGNHRRYQSMKANARSGTCAIFESYKTWVNEHGAHRDLFVSASQEVGQNPEDNFDYLNNSIKKVTGFGRLGRFDFLTLVGKLELAAIDPPSAYLVGSSGPLRGARLLFGEPSDTAASLDVKIRELGDFVGHGMQVMEDSICNWQKSPAEYQLFRG